MNETIIGKECGFECYQLFVEEDYYVMRQKLPRGRLTDRVVQIFGSKIQDFFQTLYKAPVVALNIKLETSYHFSRLYLHFPDFFQVWKIQDSV